MPEPTTPDEAAETAELLAKVRRKQYAQETLAHDRFRYGPQSPQLTPSIERVGQLEYELGNVDGARERFRQALEIDEAAMGTEHPDTLRCRDKLETIEGDARREQEQGPAS